MSYLVDALRKAERERRLGEVPTLSSDVLEYESDARQRSGWPLVVTALVLVNAVLFVTLWLGNPFVSSSTGGSSAPNADASPPRPVSTEPASVGSGSTRPAPTPASSAQPGRRAAERGSAAVTPGEDRSAMSEDAGRSATAATSTPSTFPDASRSPEPANRIDSERDRREPDLDSPVPPLSGLPAAQRQRIPDLTMNGHLYSSQPGRSFVLINGRRYHEGERIAEGPAIETIDIGGAVLKDGDIRFRLNAPR